MLPKQLQQHVDEVAALEEQLAAPVENPETPEDPAPDGQTEPPPPPDPAPPPPEDRGDAGEGSSDDETKWEHKYRRLQGKYDAEVPRLHQEVKELRAMLAEMQSAPKEPEPEPEKSLITDDDHATYGPDMVDFSRRVAAEATNKVKAELMKLQKENAELRQHLGSVQGATFETRLLQAVPDFPQINTDQRWVAWLNEHDRMLRGPRRPIVQKAYADGDVEAVKAYIDLFRQTLGEPQATQEAPAAPDRRQAELRRQVQPQKASATSKPSTNQPRMYTDQEARQVFDKVQQLIRRGQYDEADKLEREISLAYEQNRVSG